MQRQIERTGCAALLSISLLFAARVGGRPSLRWSRQPYQLLEARYAGSAAGRRSGKASHHWRSPLIGEWRNVKDRDDVRIFSADGSYDDRIDGDRWRPLGAHTAELRYIGGENERARMRWSVSRDGRHLTINWLEAAPGGPSVERFRRVR